MSKIIDPEKKQKLLKAVRKYLESNVGENWHKQWKKEKGKKFPYPVLARIHGELNSNRLLEERRVAYQIMKKIHISELEEVKALLDSFLDERTQALYWQEAKKSIEPSQKTKGLDQLLFMAA